MIQYNLRLDDQIKEKAQKLAEKKNISENNLYQMAIQDYLMRTEAEDFFDALMKRIIPPQEKRKILQKLRQNKADVLYTEDLRKK